MALLALVDEMTEDLFDLLADMRIAGLGVSRWELTSAPRRIELAAELQAPPARVSYPRDVVCSPR